MITIIETTKVIDPAYGDNPNKVVAVLQGLSTDEKPLGFANGSSLFTMDNSKKFKFDEENMEWLPWEGE